MVARTGSWWQPGLLRTLFLYARLASRLFREPRVPRWAKAVPILMLHGNYDPVIPVTAGKQSCEFLRQLGYKIEWQTFPMQHAVCPEEILVISSWLQQQLL